MTDAFPATIETARTLLRPVTAADAEAIYAGYAQDRAVCRFLTWTPHASRSETDTYIRMCLEATAARTYAVIDRQGGTLCGAFDLRRDTSHRLSFGYVLARAWWGRGLMTEILTEATAWALRQDGIWRVGAVCDTDNVASARVMEKAGLTREGTLRRWLVHPNLGSTPRDCISFAKVR